MCFPWILARLLLSAVRVRIRSRSKPTRLPSTITIHRTAQCPGLGNDVSLDGGPPVAVDRRRGVLAIVSAFYARPS